MKKSTNFNAVNIQEQNVVTIVGFGTYARRSGKERWTPNLRQRECIFQFYEVRSLILKCSFFWNFFAAMKKLTKAMCWEMVAINKDAINKVGVAIYQKPTSNECYEKRAQEEPPVCKESDDPNAAWYELTTHLFKKNFIFTFSHLFKKNFIFPFSAVEQKGILPLSPLSIATPCNRYFYLNNTSVSNSESHFDFYIIYENTNVNLINYEECNLFSIVRFGT